MASAIIRAKDLQSEDISFGPIRKNDLGGKFIPLRNKNGEKLIMQFPEMRTPFGLSEMKDQNTGNVSYSVPLSFDLDNTEAMDVRSKLETIDELIVQKVHENVKTLMGKTVKIDVLRDGLYRPMVTPSKDPEKYGPMLKLKVLKNRDGTFVPEAYNSHKQRIDLDSLERGGSSKTLVEFVHVYVIDGKFGVTIRLVQIKQSQSKKISGYSFVDESDDEGADQLMEDEMNEDDF